jgi:hypothetical protein
VFHFEKILSPPPASPNYYRPVRITHVYIGWVFRVRFIIFYLYTIGGILLLSDTSFHRRIHFIEILF